jgi:hypothetical protein
VFCKKIHNKLYSLLQSIPTESLSDLGSERARTKKNSIAAAERGKNAIVEGGADRRPHQKFTEN